jgi:hypothetical protein
VASGDGDAPADAFVRCKRDASEDLWLEPVRRADRQPLVAIVPDEDRGSFGVEQACGLRHQCLQDVIQPQRLVQMLVHVVQNLQLAPALLGLIVQARVLDGQSGLSSEGGDQLELVIWRNVAGPVGQHQCAVGRPARHERHRDERMKVLGHHLIPAFAGRLHRGSWAAMSQLQIAAAVRYLFLNG